MRLFLGLYLSILSCGVTAQDSGSALHNIPTIELVSFHYPPYHDQSLPNGGFVSEIVRQAFITKKYDVKIDFNLSRRAFDSAKFNFADGIYMIGHSHEDDTNFYFSKPILYIKLTLLGLSNNPKLSAKYSSPTQLKILTIAINENSVLPDVLKDDSFNIETMVDDRSAFWSLLSGKIDLILVDEGVARYLLANEFKEQAAKIMFWSEQSINQTAQYLAVSRHHPQAKKIIFTFNSGLDALKDSGTYDTIYNSCEKNS